MAPKSSVPVSSWGISAQHAERLGWPEPSRSQGRDERHDEDGSVNEPNRHGDVAVVEDESTLGREAGNQRTSKPKGNDKTNDKPGGRDQRRFDQDAGKNLRRPKANGSQATNRPTSPRHPPHADRAGAET